MIPLPVEILLHIFSFAFNQDVPSLPFDPDQYSLSSALPLLRLNKAYHQHCLPLLYRRLIITRPHHWVRIFHRTSGCLNHPQHGPTRIGWVQQIVFTVIPLPLVLDPDAPLSKNTEMSDLLPYHFPLLVNVRRVLYIPPSPLDVEQAVQDLKLNIRQYTDIHTASFRQTLASLPANNSLASPLEDVHQAMFSAIAESLDPAQTIHMNRLGASLENGSSMILETQLRDGCFYFFNGPDRLDTMSRRKDEVTLRLHCPPVEQGRSLTKIRDFLFDYLDTDQVFDTVLVGFPRSLRMAYKQHLSSEECINLRYEEVDPESRPKVASPHRNVTWESYTWFVSFSLRFVARFFFC